jgi:hypothetical protein
MPAPSPRPGAIKILLGGLIAAGCSLTSLDRYFQCEPGHPDCKDAAVVVGADAGSGATDAGGTGTASAGESAGGESAGGGAVGGTGALANGGGGGASDTGGGGASGGSAGATGAGRGESCVASADCAQLTCFRNICGDPLELAYLDTPDVGSDPKAARWIKFEVLITNRTTASYALSRLKVRYYYTENGATSEFQLLSTMSPPTADTDVTSAFGVSQGWTYLEIGFDAKAGTLGPGKQSGAVKVGVHDKDFGTVTFIETDDYSYVPDVGMSHAPSANRHVTLYVDSVLVSGDEPKTPPPP